MGAGKDIKQVMKLFIPPVFLRTKKLSTNNKQVAYWTGDYWSWQEAKSSTTGYDDKAILEKCKNALLKVKNGEAKYERDSVLFDEIQYSWGLLAGLQRVALENDGKLCVIDFGGSLGSTYYQNRDFLKTIKGLQWCIVEQSSFVDCGRACFENEQLKFYYTVEECLSSHQPNVIILSSVLQYLEKPFEWIEKITRLGVPYIIIDRAAFVNNERDILTIQTVPEEIYKASYPAWFFNEEKLLEECKGYQCLSSFESYCDPPVIINSGMRANWKGFILKRN